MNNLLPTRKFDQCEICAYHETGHILFAYLCGYRCIEAQLVDENNDNGFTSYAVIDYGKDAYLASKFIGSAPSIDFFKSLALGEKLEALEIGRRLARIYLGGSVTAAVYNNKGNIHIPLPMQIDYMDLLRVEFTQFVVQEVSAEKDDILIEHGLRDALYTLSNVNVWKTIEDLAERLLQSSRLQKNDIEECLEQHGIIYDAESRIDAAI